MKIINNISKRKVPYKTIVTRDGIVANLCYFKKNNVFRLFYPAFSNNQTRKDFKTENEAIEYVKNKLIIK